ncbi:MAG: ferrous iron transport protein A [Firmicutes bacterium]|nr:ferrous iron transport protein A [Bacillota bacterium]HOB34516.1 ferrous iron transport protein A [Bacillota bacterium]HPZ90552.1 ferrous iron transport protein A [Bacillota bacterium]HQE02394.1 ferrous iron transport protein A [Bacillota bacterium]
MNLLAAAPGKRYVIVRIRDEAVRRQAECLGMGEGEDVYCVARQRNGPVILGRNGQMVAVGAETARKIQITLWRPPRG